MFQATNGTGDSDYGHHLSPGAIAVVAVGAFIVVAVTVAYSGLCRICMCGHARDGYAALPEIEYDRIINSSEPYETNAIGDYQDVS